MIYILEFWFYLFFSVGPWARRPVSPWPVNGPVGGPAGPCNVDASLFNVHARKTDADIRFGFDFILRVYPKPTDEQKRAVNDVVCSVLPSDGKVPGKAAHEPKLHSKETIFGDSLPRPRLPKSLRQLYGNSADA